MNYDLAFFAICFVPLDVRGQIGRVIIDESVSLYSVFDGTSISGIGVVDGQGTESSRT